MPGNREVLEIVDSDGRVMGLAERSRFHGDPSLIHKVVHVLVFNEEGDLLLQKRSMKKDVAPGKWDTSVGGHVNPGEDVRNAAQREMKEELGISADLKYLYRYLFSNHVETELVTTYSCVYAGRIDFDRDEIDDVRYWSLREIEEDLGKNIFSNHFEREIRQYLVESRQ